MSCAGPKAGHARRGILIKGAAFLEKLSDVASVMFDKTGALTSGELALTRVEASDPEAALRVASALWRGSEPRRGPRGR